jgi:hypothetical protein
MSYKIRCYTLFDITKTGILNRKPPINGSIEQIQLWEKRRNTQTNFDTIIQVISLRSQPEDITNSSVQDINIKEFGKFGFIYENEDLTYNIWSFEFTISHHSVFDDGIDELGNLHNDCNGVPMIKTSNKLHMLPECLDTTPELKNIHFEVLNEE